MSALGSDKIQLSLSYSLLSVVHVRLETSCGSSSTLNFFLLLFSKVMRLMDNNELPAESIEDIKEDLEFYIETSEDVEAIEVLYKFENSTV